MTGLGYGARWATILWVGATAALAQGFGGLSFGLEALTSPSGRGADAMAEPSLAQTVVVAPVHGVLLAVFAQIVLVPAAVLVAGAMAVSPRRPRRRPTAVAPRRSPAGSR